MEAKKLWTGGALALALAAAPAWAVAEAEPGDAMAGDGASVASGEMPSGHVSRSAFTHAIVDREPQDELSEVANDQDRVYYFTELRDLAGETVVHRWEWNGEIMAEVSFEVGADRWRVHSSKNLDPQWLGEWTVSVLDAGGHVLTAQQFQYVASDSVASEEGSAAPPAAPGDSDLE